jgi:hypothetical protein
LPGHHEEIESQEALHECFISTHQQVSARVDIHLGLEHRVVLGQGMLSLGREAGRRASRDLVEEERLFDRRDEGVAQNPEDGGGGADGVRDLAAFLGPPHVVARVVEGLGAQRG